MNKGIKTEFKTKFNLGMRRLDDPAQLRVPAHPSAREAFTREAAHTQDAAVAEEISKRELCRWEVVEKAKFYYNYRYPEPIFEVLPEPPPEKDFWDAWIARCRRRARQRREERVCSQQCWLEGEDDGGGVAQ